MKYFNRMLQFQGEKSPSIASKVVLTSWNLICILGAIWMTFFATNTGDLFGSRDRQVTLLICACIYVIRSAISLFVFMKRKIPWWEGAIGCILFFLLRDGFRTPWPLGFADVVGLLMYISGSYFGTASEYYRYLWKNRPENQGHLYTEGLFKYCRHMNYFGDLLLFCGFSILTQRLWTGIVPFMMGVNFVFLIIPAHDAYLTIRYRSDFEKYSQKTKKLIPFLY
jgi:hypothetical protein